MTSQKRYTNAAQRICFEGKAIHSGGIMVECFVQNRIEVWSAEEGQQQFDNHVDKLMNHIRYWLASGKSLKTSARIKTRLAQIVQENTSIIPPFKISCATSCVWRFCATVNPDPKSSRSFKSSAKNNTIGWRKAARNGLSTTKRNAPPSGNLRSR